MKWNLASKMAALVMTILGVSDIPTAEGKVNFDEAQQKKLQAFLKDEAQYDDMLEAFNKDLSGMETEAQREARLKSELRAALEANTDLTENEITKKVEEGDVATQLSAMNDQLRSQKALIDKLMGDPEEDTPLAEDLANAGKKLGHSASHLFSSSKDWNAFASRPWNERAAGIVTDATEFSDRTIVDKLNDDMDHYFRENPEEIKSLHRDNFGLPAFWPKRMKVDDKVADGTIVSAEISQARKLGWLPKNKQLIQPEEGQIFPVQIDIEFVGYYLQKMEASWLNKFNKEGSQPYKESFVRFLVSELDKKARVEDRISTIKGVHVATPEDATVAGKFINRQNGLLYQFFKGRDITKKYKAFAVGTPDPQNILDYVRKIVESLPLDVRRNPNLKFYISPAWLTAYGDRYEQVHATQTDYKGVPPYPKGYNTMSFVPLVDLEGLDFMFITFDDNIELLENIPKEKSLYHFEYLKRIIYIWADYKQGVRLIHIGTKIADTDPLAFKVQSVWSNDVPIFNADFAIPVFDDTTGEIAVKFNNMKVASDWNTTITKLTGTVPGQLIKIEGNTEMANAKSILSSGNIAVDTAFPLKNGGTLTLFVKADGSIVELSRTTGPAAAADVDLNFEGSTVDAGLGEDFAYTGITNQTLTAILNGVEGQQVIINGKEGGSNTITISSVAGKINMASNAVLATSADNVVLVLSGGVWYEAERTVA